jgi:uncharacterized protein
MNLPVMGLAILALVGAGIVGGLLAGMLGVGGGIIIVPILYAVLGALGYGGGLGMKVAVATSLATIIATSAASTRSHHKRSSVMWPLVRSWIVPIVLGVVVGCFVDGRLLAAVFAAVALTIALRTLFFRPAPKDGAGFSNDVVKWMFGAVVGMVSTLMGIGGGTLSVPILTTFDYDVRKAVGTAAAIGFLIGVPGTLGYIATGVDVPGRPPFSLGFVSVPSALALLPLTVVMAPVGARIAHSVKPCTLELWFALFLTITAAKMIFDLSRSLL